MLRKPRALAKLVNGIVRESPLPVTVKVRHALWGRALAKLVNGIVRESPMPCQ